MHNSAPMPQSPPYPQADHAHLRPELRSTRLNLGCGRRYRTDWTNADLFSADPSVLSIDLRYPLPVADARFGLVYHSHVLEHLDAAAGQQLLRECCRILAPGGTIRVVVPDLELLAAWYLQALSAAAGSPGVSTATRLTAIDPAALLRHRWAASMIIDQCARDSSGGDLAHLWSDSTSLKADAWLAPKSGLEMHGLAAQIDGQPSSLPPLSPPRKSLPRRLRESLAKRLLGRAETHALRIGRFRLAGESHKFMYDRLSLASALTLAGFSSITVHTAASTSTDLFDPAGLDTDLAGAVYKPESLFIEARKPRGHTA